MSTGPKSAKDKIKLLEEKVKSLLGDRRRIGYYGELVKKNIKGVADNKNKVKIIEKRLEDMEGNNSKKKFDNIQENFDKVENFMGRINNNEDLLEQKINIHKNRELFIANFLANKYPEFKGKWEENERKRKEKRSEEMAVDALATIGRKTIKMKRLEDMEGNNSKKKFDNIQENFDKVENFMGRINNNEDLLEQKINIHKNRELFIANFLANKYPEFKGKWEENERKRKEKRSEEMAVDALATIGRKTIKISKF